jgi:hypothetical protein
MFDAAIAQLGERQTEDLQLSGSIPALRRHAMPECEVRRVDDGLWFRTIRIRYSLAG